MASFPSVSIDKFLGMNTSRDELSLIPGQLSKNQNYLYMANGGLKERGGGEKLSNPPSAGEVFSLDNYRNQSGTNYLITNQGTDAYYYNSGWNALSLTLTSGKKIRWAQAGKGAATALYGVNANEGVIKITGSTPTGSIVANSPTDAVAIKKHKNRLFTLNVDGTLSFTEALGFETWNPTENTIDIVPGVDGDGVALEIWGDSLFIIKEFGIYVLPNAADPVPKVNWSVLRADAATGSKSPDTVRRTKNGIYFLSSDNFIRKIAPAISFSSGEYTMGGSGTPIVSVPIEDDLELLLQDSSKNNAQAKVHNELYILSFESVNNSGSYNDLTYYADTEKFLTFEGNPEPQPYWGEFLGFNYDFFTTQISNGKVKLYGAKGTTTVGAVHETLNDTIHNDDGAAIESKAILGWFPIGGESLYKKIKQVYFVGDTENWELNVTLKAYKYGTAVPSEGEGKTYIYTSTTVEKAVVGTAVVGTALLSEVAVGSSKFRTSLKGHLFRAEMFNLNADEFTRIDKLVVYYRPIRNR